jgi:Amt family ammonium transporter
MFAIITPPLMCGAFAERMKFSSYLVFIALWSLVVYSPVAHWVWNVGGFLHKDGTLDFAGGHVVHQTAGFSALIAALVFGKRKDFGKVEYAPHNVPFVLLGAGILWFGWFGFNAGSAGSAGELAVSAFNATHFAAASAMMVWVLAEWMVKGKPTVTGAAVGAVVGLVVVTPGSGFVSTISAVTMGAIGALFAFVVLIARGKTQIDDSLDVFACHGMGGFAGAILTGVFASKAVNAAGADGGMAQFMIQLKGSFIVAGYSMVMTLILLKAIDVVIGLRPDAEGEEKGLDLNEHGEKAYHS